MKKKILSVVLIILVLVLLVLGAMWLDSRSPDIKMWRYLSDKEYTRVSLDKVKFADREKDKLLIQFDYSKMTSEVLQESLQIKKDVEWFLTQNSELYSNLIVDVYFMVNSENSTIWMYTGDNDGYRSLNENELGYGHFNCPDCSIFVIDDTVQFDSLRLIGFKDMEFLTEVLPLQSNLQHLELVVDDEFANNEIEKLCNVLPDCTIIINGITVQQGK